MFRGFVPRVDLIVARIYAWHSLDVVAPDRDMLRAPPILDDQHTYPFGFYDGAAQNGVCCVGIVIKLSRSHYYHLHLKAGCGSNTRAELVVLWGTPLVCFCEEYYAHSHIWRFTICY